MVKLPSCLRVASLVMGSPFRVTFASQLPTRGYGCARLSCAASARKTKTAKIVESRPAAMLPYSNSAPPLQVNCGLCMATSAGVSPDQIEEGLRQRAQRFGIRAPLLGKRYLTSTDRHQLVQHHRRRGAWTPDG